MAIEDPLVWVMGPQRLVTFVISALEMFLLTYLLTYLSKIDDTAPAAH